MRKKNRLKDSTFLIVNPFAFLAAIGGLAMVFILNRNKSQSPAVKKILSQEEVEALRSEK
ncbi:hypothetical protein AB1K83_04800 [Sporosarcina sp. 179-K 3D1 HS]|uniref:hypothetical protein n=1 Tax=Sporosarcina sp. 179-K 3D1 HS TaxID=3232169 RepID=UPI0039A25C94